jgi:hypothetical protein
LIKEKPEAERKQIAERIKRMDLDVLAVQEAEDIDTLRRFARDDLKGLYKHSVLIEGNDPRLIDVGLLSKRPLAGSLHGRPLPTLRISANPSFPAICSRWRSLGMIGRSGCSRSS